MMRPCLLIRLRVISLVAADTTREVGQPEAEAMRNGGKGGMHRAPAPSATRGGWRCCSLRRTAQPPARSRATCTHPQCLRTRGEAADGPASAQERGGGKEEDAGAAQEVVADLVGDDRHADGHRIGQVLHTEVAHPDVPSRRRDCHFADTPSPCLLKHLLKAEVVSAK